MTFVTYAVFWNVLFIDVMRFPALYANFMKLNSTETLPVKTMADSTIQNRLGKCEGQDYSGFSFCDLWMECEKLYLEWTRLIVYIIFTDNRYKFQLTATIGLFIILCICLKFSQLQCMVARIWLQGPVFVTLAILLVWVAIPSLLTTLCGKCLQQVRLMIVVFHSFQLLV